MEQQQLLIDRIQAYQHIWDAGEAISPGGFENLMKTEDFWDPFLHNDFQPRRGWHKLGIA
tara:strand:+ start:296 stop:475 length:180 start_codon:yes stop_codon:yes gene_type:complete